MLSEKAAYWWENTRQRLEAICTTITWVNLKTGFLEYFPAGVHYWKEIGFFQLKQGSMNVDNYAAKFEELVRFCPHYNGMEAEDSGVDLFNKFIEDSGLVDVPCKGKKFTWYSGDGRSMCRIDRFLVSDVIVNKWGVFIPFVEKEWKEMEVEGRGDFILKEKLRRLKGRLNWWNISVFGKIDLEMEDSANEVKCGDSKLEECSEDLIGEALDERNVANKKFWLNLRIKENMLVQKSRLRWLNEGDSNSNFFHKVVKERRRHNHIGPLISQGVLVEKVEEVREEVRNHFANKFIETDSDRMLLDGISFKSISSEDKLFLESPFILDEIKEAIGCCGSTKSPGPDEFSFMFIKKCWHIIEDDFMRHLLDGVLVANEVVDFVKKEGRGCLLFKVYFEKAYDKVSWNFLRYLLRRMGFGDKCRRWMEMLVLEQD
ncbi:uncharacterized protein LOC131656596 [Vicia villosa]|uniref:uncharacterized protein LOC131656596 n=1 Tax=Vicia villosa TaxID=3911 RepID=UPI00273BADBB|nr:uncharacterized protein LOC131656596 [Vicia villosa]